MARPRHVAYQVSGSLPGGEIFVNTLRFADDSSGPFTGLDLEAAVEQVKSRYASAMTTIGEFPAECFVNTVSGYVYGDGGVLVEQAVTESAPVPGSGTLSLPHQVSVVASLLTATPGRRTRGRLYLPLLGLSPVVTTGRIPSASRSAIATEIADMLADLRVAGYDVAADGLDPVVVSTSGTLATPITSVRVGDVYDTQRRRRNALVETYSTASLPS